jgi:hypothetical protein
MCLGESTTADGGLNSKYFYPLKLEEVLNEISVGTVPKGV